MDQERFDNMIKVIDESYDLIQEYDSKPRQFGKVMLYPVETHTLAIIGNHPGINASMIAKELKKTLSASSQILKKLEQKGLISRTKNPHNNREYNLYLTVGGRQIFDLHGQFDKKIMKIAKEIFCDVDIATLIQCIKFIKEILLCLES